MLSRFPLLAALALALLAAPAGAEPASASSAANFLKVGVSPRAVGMGEAVSGLADDVSAMAYNPAGLAFLTRQELQLAHNEHFEGVRQEWFAYAFPSRENGTIAASANVLYIEPIAGFDENDRPIAETSATDAAYGLAYAYKLGAVAVGAGGQVVTQRLGNNSTWGAAFNAGALADTPLEGLRLGVSVLHMGTRMTFARQAHSLPLAVKGGLSWKPFGVQPRDWDLTFAVDATADRDRDGFASAGFEYLRNNVLAVRAGWRATRDTDVGYSLGVGIYLSRLSTRAPELIFDYAFADHGALGAVHRAGVTLKFGRPVALRRPARSAPQARQAQPDAAAEPEADAEPRPAAAPRRKPAKSDDALWVNP